MRLTMRFPRSFAGVLAVLLLNAPLLAGCAAAGGHQPAAGRVTGRLLMEGGALGPGGRQPGKRPIPGTVTFTAAGRQPVSVQVPKAGTFTVLLPPGRYRVFGRSPRIIQVSNGAKRELPCSQPLRVTVTAHHSTTIAVTCIVP